MLALDDRARAGKILSTGVSDWPAWEVARAATLAEQRGWSPFVALQARYNLLERTPERELLPMARALDLAVQAWSLSRTRAAGRQRRSRWPGCGPGRGSSCRSSGSPDWPSPRTTWRASRWCSAMSSSSAWRL
jgi:aryl-alcohol dehydrogenase-like predicted oxidoreductase